MHVPEEMYAKVNEMMRNYAAEIGEKHIRDASGDLTGCIRVGHTDFTYLLSSRGVTVGTKTKPFDELDQVIPELEKLIKEHSK